MPWWEVTLSTGVPEPRASRSRWGAACSVWHMEGFHFLDDLPWKPVLPRAVLIWGLLAVATRTEKKAALEMWVGPGSQSASVSPTLLPRVLTQVF